MLEKAVYPELSLYLGWRLRLVYSSNESHNRDLFMLNFYDKGFNISCMH